VTNQFRQVCFNTPVLSTTTQFCYEAKLPNLKLITRAQQFLVSLPDIMLLATKSLLCSGFSLKFEFEKAKIKFLNWEDKICSWEKTKFAHPITGQNFDKVDEIFCLLLLINKAFCLQL